VSATTVELTADRSSDLWWRERSRRRRLQATAAPLGYSRDDMTGLLALFTRSGNDPAYSPTTPFQILHTAPSATLAVFETRAGEPCEPPSTGCGLSFTDLGAVSNTFGGAAEQSFFVPVDNADDSPPIVGEFPTTPTRRSATCSTTDSSVGRTSRYSSTVGGRRSVPPPWPARWRPSRCSTAGART
jgi:hypothetical protein